MKEMTLAEMDRFDPQFYERIGPIAVYCKGMTEHQYIANFNSELKLFKVIGYYHIGQFEERQMFYFLKMKQIDKKKPVDP